jgi:hypothetical protein
MKKQTEAVSNRPSARDGKLEEACRKRQLRRWAAA